MVESRFKKVFHLTIVILVIIFICRCDVYDSIWSESKREIKNKQTHYTQSLNPEDFKMFGEVWPQLITLGFNENLINLKDNERPSENLNWKEKIWFTYKRIDVDRLFYIKNRIISILNEIAAKNTANALLTFLGNKKDKSFDKLKIDLKRVSEENKFDAYETELVKSYENEFRKLLNQYQ